MNGSQELDTLTNTSLQGRAFRVASASWGILFNVKGGAAGGLKVEVGPTADGPWAATYTSTTVSANVMQWFHESPTVWVRTSALSTANGTSPWLMQEVC